MITVDEVMSDSEHELGVEPGLQKDGVEAHLQELLAEHIQTLGQGTVARATRIRNRDRSCGPLGCVTPKGHPAIEIKRRGEIDGVEQRRRYLDLLNRDPLLAPVRGVFAAQEIKPQARVLATDRGIRCVVLDYDTLRGIDSKEDRLF